MNTYFLMAGILSLILGFVHSILGEYLIFRDKRDNGNLVPTKVNKDFKEQHLRIIWATWHLSSFFGWCIGAFLIKISVTQGILNAESISFLIYSILIAMVASSLLVLIATKGKHPGWIVLLLIGILLMVGN